MQEATTSAIVFAARPSIWKRLNPFGGIRGTLTIRMLATGLSFVTGLAISRGFGASVAGQYFFFYAIMQLSAIIFAFGFPQLNLIRFARARVRQSASMAKRDFRNSQCWIVTFGGTVAFASLLIPSTGWRPAELSWIVLGLVAGAVLALLRNLSESLKGFDYVVTGLTLEYLIPSLILLAAICIEIFALKSSGVGFVVVATTVSYLFAFAVGTIYLERLIADDAKTSLLESPTADPRNSDWTIIIANFTENVFQSTAWTLPAILLPWVAGDNEAGYFGLAQRLAGVASVILIAVMSHFTQIFSYLYESVQEAKLLKSFWLSAKVTTLFFAPFALIYCVLPTFVMNCFGADFVAGAPYLALLAITHLLTLPGGVAVEYLRVAGEQKQLFWLSLTTGIISVLGIVAAGLFFGGGGIVIMFAGTLAAKRLLALALVLRRSYPISVRCQSPTKTQFNAVRSGSHAQ